MSEIRDGMEGKVEILSEGDERDEWEQRGCEQGGARGGLERNSPPCFPIRLFFFSERGPRKPGGGREREGEGEGEGRSDDTCVE